MNETASAPPTDAGGRRALKLGDLLRRHNEIIHPGDRKEGEAAFVGLEHIEPHTGRRIGSGTIDLGKLTGRKPTFRAGQIVYGYLRPYLNKVWLADFDGCSSVDQFAFDVRSDLADPEFLAAFLRSETFLRRSAVVTTTGQLPRISIDEIEAVEIELPPLAEQKRIAAELATALASAEKARRAAQKRRAAAEALPSAFLRQVFEGQEVIGTRVQLSDAAIIVMGQSPPGASYNREERGEPLLNGPSEFGIRHPIPVQWTTEPTHFCESGDILFCVRGATTGRKAIADRRYCIGRGLAAIRGIEGRATTDYLWYLLDWIRDGMLKRAAGSTFVNLPGRELEEFEVGLPDPSTQHRLASELSRRVEAAEVLIARCREELASIDALPAALLRQAFQGVPS